MVSWAKLLRIISSITRAVIRDDEFFVHTNRPGLLSTQGGIFFRTKIWHFFESQFFSFCSGQTKDLLASEVAQYNEITNSIQKP